MAMIRVLSILIFFTVSNFSNAQNTPIETESNYHHFAGYGLLLLVFVIFFGLLKFGDRKDIVVSKPVLKEVRTVFAPYSINPKENIQHAPSAGILNMAYLLVLLALILNIILFILLL